MKKKGKRERRKELQKQAMNKESNEGDEEEAG